MSQGRESSSRAKLSAAKRTLLEQRLRGKVKGTETSANRIPRYSKSAPAPLSFAQHRLWFLAQLEPESSAYHLPLAFHIRGHLDADALETTLAEIVRRHEIMRTTYPTIDGEPVQQVGPAVFKLPRIDLRDLPPKEADSEGQRLFAVESRHHFDLREGPLFRAFLLQTATDRSVLLLSFHHILLDEWSFDIFCSELHELYGAFSDGRSPVLPPLPIQYGDFAVWQRGEMQGAKLERQKRYWLEQLADAPQAIELPLDRPRSGVQTAKGSRHQIRVPQVLAKAVKTFSLREGTTLFMTLLTAFKVFLYRYSNQRDLIVGTPITNRSRTETEPLIGLFLNVLALRTDLSGAPSFRKLLAQVREVALAAYSQQDLPFEQLIEELHIERDLTRAPLIQVMFILQSTNLSALELPGLVIEQAQFGARSAVYDLTLFFSEQEGELVGAMDYNPDLFDEETVSRMAGHWRILLEAAIANPDCPIASLPMLSEAERCRQILDWNATTTALADDPSLVRRLSNQAKRIPESPAFLLPNGDVLTYRKLNGRANQLAHHLRFLGVEPGTRVGLCLERSFDAVIGVLGIFKAGGVYVPLDPTYPTDRLAFMVEDAALGVILTHQAARERLPDVGPTIVDLDSDSASIEQQSGDDPSIARSPDDHAYLIYTSGSTGRPKGLIIPHRQMLNRLMWMWEHYPFAPDEVSCQKTALSFVDSLWELLGPLLKGSPTLIVPDKTLRDLDGFVDTLGAHGVTRLWLVPSLLEAMLDVCGDIRTRLPRLNFWVASGEPLPVDLLERFRARLPGAELFNLYGTSEAWDVSWFDPGDEVISGSTVPIGRPIANTYLYILNEALQPVPPGVVGELYVSGVGLAEGYLNRTTYNDSIFVSNPFPPPRASMRQAARMYRTGDLARYRANGTVEFVGRADNQLKIRGFRVEPGEIETRLREHSDLRQAVVIPTGESSGERGLVAYVVPQAAEIPSPGTLQAFLRRALPPYMIPSSYVNLKQLPLTPSGKIDRKGLPDPQTLLPQGTRDESERPQDELEAVLLDIWRTVLGREELGVCDDFFDFGGHSLSALRVVRTIEVELGFTVEIMTMFEAPTVRLLAQNLRSQIEG